jgi:hypothetical protein
VKKEAKQYNCDSSAVTSCLREKEPRSEKQLNTNFSTMQPRGDNAVIFN